MAWHFPLAFDWVDIGLYIATFVLATYLLHVNRLLRGVPDDVQALSGPQWEPQELKALYDELEKHPIDYTDNLPPRLDRRYIVTGGNGLVGGYIVLQLLARGTPAYNIRIIDIRSPERTDLTVGPAADIDFVKTDIRSSASVNAAFQRPWDASVTHLPLTVFHTAAVILASDRSEYQYDFPYAVNVEGTRNVLAAAKVAGADVFSSTSSASICVLPVNPWVSFWAKEPKNFWQTLDGRDFEKPLKTREEFYGNYPASKAEAERLVCASNGEGFATGCIRPANGVYGSLTDNTVGGALSKSVLPTWIPHIVQNFVHGANVAIAHLQHEAVLLDGGSIATQAGRPFVVTDPNPPFTYSDVYRAISTLSATPFRIMILPPVLMLVMAHAVEGYGLLRHHLPWLGRFTPSVTGDGRQLQPGIFSICTHLVASDAEARKPVEQGGLGYEGVMTTMQGMVSEILEWNREIEDDKQLHKCQSTATKRKGYTTPVAFADQLRQAVAATSIVAND